MQRSMPAAVLGTQTVLPIEEQSQVADARRRATRLAASHGFDAAAAGNVGLAVTEAATNILKHAERGRLVLGLMEEPRGVGVEVIAVDNGPGMGNVIDSMRDGHSTAGSMGTGLGALARAATELEVYSAPNRGTVLRMEFWPPQISRRDEFELGVICLPRSGEEVSGDAWSVRTHAGRQVVLVTDGLGHGPDAAKAARVAISVLEKHADLGPAVLLERMHKALASTRGAAVAVAALDAEHETGVYAGVGNIGAAVLNGNDRIRHLVSSNGIVGHRLASVREVPFDLPRGGLLVLHSDGIGTHWDLAAYPGLVTRHPALVAGVLWRDFERGRDDVTVVAFRYRVAREKAS